MDEQRVFLITGASAGIGAATARLAAERGFRVALTARRPERIEALAVPGDVASWEDNERLVAAALEAFGRIDVVLANAGFGAKPGFLADTPERWRAMVLTNVLGPAYTVRAALPEVIERKGHVLITGSVGGRRVRPGSFYSCTKWANTAMGEALRQDLDGTGLRVTVVEPGTVETEFAERSQGGEPLEAADVARAILWAVEQPARVDVNEILVRPTAQHT